MGLTHKSDKKRLKLQISSNHFPKLDSHGCNVVVDNTDSGWAISFLANNDQSNVVIWNNGHCYHFGFLNEWFLVGDSSIDA